jgi:translation initiation factor 2 gamma subunit (eIF-2gamma)
MKAHKESKVNTGDVEILRLAPGACADVSDRSPVSRRMDRRWR